MGSKTLYNNSGTARTAYKKMIFNLGTGVMSVGGNIRTPIFYDYNDTNYYLDAASTGTSLSAAGTVHASNSNMSSYQLNGTYVMDSSRNLVNIVGITSTGNAVLGNSRTDKVNIYGNLGIGHNSYPKIAYPGQNALWGGSGGTTGQIVIDLPGTLGNYDMMYMEIDIYEYSGDAATKLIIGGHNWNSGGNSNTSTLQWYNVNVQVLGRLTKPVYFGRRNDGSNERRCIAIGETNSSWNYATVHVSKVHGAEFYGTAIDWVGDWNIAQTTSSSYFTKNPTTNFNDGGSQTFETNGIGEANHWFGSTSVRSPIFYDLDNTNYYVNPASGSVLGGTINIHADSDSSLSIQNAGTDAIGIFAHAGDELYLGSNNASCLRLVSGGDIEAVGHVLSKGKKQCTASIGNSYVRVFAVSTESSQLASVVKVTGTSHGSSHVGAFTAEIIVNHYQDVKITSSCGNYTNGVIKVEGDGNGQYTMSYKSVSANAATYYFTIEALSSELSITTNPTSTASTAITSEHKMLFGMTMSGEGGSNPNLCFASDDGDTNVRLIRSGDGLQIKTGNSGQYTTEIHQNGYTYGKGLYDIDDTNYLMRSTWR